MENSVQNYKTEQEAFWAGDFGKGYIERNRSDALQSAKIAMWPTMLRSANRVTSIKEFGCNIGLNLFALNKLKPNLVLSGIEINEEAAGHAEQLGIGAISNYSIIDKIDSDPVDLTFTDGVLIHIYPDMLDNVYENLFRLSKRYILISEYYNPSPVMVEYRGEKDRLFKRDFAGDMIDRFGLNLVDYGFFYKRDNWAPQDDVNWFLMEKQDFYQDP